MAFGIPNKKEFNIEDEYINWWILAKAFYQLNSIQNADKCQKQSQAIIKRSSLMISEAKHQTSFLKSDIIKKEIWDNYTIIKAPSSQDKLHSNELKYCPECGISNSDQNKFCSECGNNLLKPSN